MAKRARTHKRTSARHRPNPKKVSKPKKQRVNFEAVYVETADEVIFMWMPEGLRPIRPDDFTIELTQSSRIVKVVVNGDVWDVKDHHNKRKFDDNIVMVTMEDCLIMESLTEEEDRLLRHRIAEGLAMNKLAMSGDINDIARRLEPKET